MDCQWTGVAISGVGVSTDGRRHSSCSTTERLSRLVLLLLLLVGCANQVSPIPDAGPLDAGTTPADGGMQTMEMILERANLAPAVDTATNESHRLTGRLRAAGDGRAETANHRMRGGLVPTTP